MQPAFVTVVSVYQKFKNLNFLAEKKKSRPESVDCTPSDSIIPGSSERPLLPLQPQSKEQKGPNCIKVLTTSGWNPPPGRICQLPKKKSYNKIASFILRLSQVAW